MTETYNIKVTKVTTGYEATIESPALHVEASTLEAVLLEIERALVAWKADQERSATIPA